MEERMGPEARTRLESRSSWGEKRKNTYGPKAKNGTPEAGFWEEILLL